MRFKTTIEIVTEAQDKNEAMEIAGEYLSGNIISGVRMKCRAKSLNYYKVRSTASVAVLVLMVTVNILFMINSKQSKSANRGIAGIDAINPPLKTYDADKSNAKFKKEWQDVQTREALDYLKK